MTDRSRYLAAALEALGSPAQAPAAGGLDLSSMARVKDQRAAWEAQNPGKSYAMNGLRQLGQSLGFGAK